MKYVQTICLLALLSIMACLMPACDSFREDVSDLTDVLIPKKPGEAARMMFDQRDADARREGTVLISNSIFGDGPVYVDSYRDMVRNEQHPLVLAASARALARYGEPSDAELLVVLLKHENHSVRWEAAKGLQRLHNPEQLTPMLEVLGDVDESTDVRLAIANGLGQYASDTAFQGLIAALDARPLAINVEAARALTKITGQQHGFDQIAWLDWYDATPIDQRFVDEVPYTYPTYDRDETFWDKLTFWHTPLREQPGTPTGLTPAGRRSTYEEDQTPTP